jgi:GNAT superfamily N-acetyltransferase
MFEIRRYLPDDALYLMQLHVAPMLHTGAYHGPGPWDDDLQDVPVAYLNSGGEFLIGVLDGVAVAMGAVRRLTDTQGEIKRMRVLPEFQGRGYGRAILAALEQFAVAAGMTTLILETGAVLVGAQQLYLSNGWVETQRGTVEGLPCIYFEKQLTSTVDGGQGTAG